MSLGLQIGIFLLGVIGLFFLPGWFALRFVFRPSTLSPFEGTLYAFVLSLGLIDLIMLILDRLSIPLTGASIVLGLLFVLCLLFLGERTFRFFGWRKTMPTHDSPVYRMSRKGALVFLLLLLSTIFVRGVYLKDAGLPTATDLGHHLYWTEIIVQSGQIPTYEKINIELDKAGQPHVTAPQPIADFIIGEHLPLAALALLGNFDFTGAYPVTFLLLINLLSVLATAVLAAAIAREWFGPERTRSVELVFLFTLLLLGPLYALASPQAKFVSGGVVGNIFGNALIPIILVAFFQAIKHRQSLLLGLGLFFSFILAFTHHLSTLVLFVILGGFVLFSFLLRYRETASTFQTWRTLFFSPAIIALFGCIFIFLLLVAVPTYLDRAVIDSALGTPTKTTRTGLSFAQASNTVGIIKMALGLAGLFLIALSRKRSSWGGMLTLAWGGMLLLMTLAPELLFLDIPSNRLGSYLVYPLALSGAFFLVTLGLSVQSLIVSNQKASGQAPLSGGFILSALIIIFAAIASNGAYENSQSLPSSPKVRALSQTFAVSRYLASVTTTDDLILKDHNYIVADSWMKLFFLRDYSYPLSRGFFSRYSEGGSRRERCTLDMISIPNTAAGKNCYAQTGVSLVVVNPAYDATQFEKSRDFIRLYESPEIHVYRRLTPLKEAPATNARENLDQDRAQ